MNNILKFPSVTTEAYYSPVSQTINFNNMYKRQFDDVVEQLSRRDFNPTTMDTASVIIHEAVHYFDHLVTLTGQLLLAKVYNALNELSSGTTETKEIVSLFNSLCSWGHSQYTKSRKSGIYDREPKNWSYSLNTGFGSNVFNQIKIDELLLLAIFKYRGSNIGTVPFSIESLWETNAMWAEITYQVYVIETSIEDEDTKNIELSLLDQKYRAYLYHSDMLVYSIAAHFSASFYGLGDIYKAFQLSKALSCISLNLPLQYYDQIKRPQGTVFREYSGAILEYSSGLNPCVVYMALLENLIEARVNVFATGLIIDLDDILSCSGLPSKDTLKKDILEEMNKINIKDTGADFSEMYAVQKANGIHLFDVYGVEGGLNVHPACFIDIANKSKSTLCQQLDDEEFEAFLKDEPEIFKRHHLFGSYENQMNQIIETLKQKNKPDF